MLRITREISLADTEIHERFVRAAGPGRQNPERNATAVELRLDIRASSLPVDVQHRLRVLGGRHVTADGVLVVVSRAHPSQQRNREAARDRMLRLLQRAAVPPKVRVPTEAPPPARERRTPGRDHSALRRAVVEKT